MSIYYTTEPKFFLQTCCSAPADNCRSILRGMHQQEVAVHKNRTAIIEVDQFDDSNVLRMCDANSADWVTVEVFFDDNSKLNVINLSGYDTHISTYGFARSIVNEFRKVYEGV